MASLIPADFDTTTLPHSEQRVVAAFLDGLPADCLVLPQLRIKDRGADRETDVVLICPDSGVLMVEVKGGVVNVSGNTWTSNGVEIKDPVQQAEDAKHGLLRYLRASTIGTSVFYIDHAIALPDVVCPAEGLGPSAPRRLVFDKLDLEHPVRAVARILRENEPVPGDRVQAFVRALLPAVTLDTADGNYYNAATAAMDETTRERLALARSMDANSRVLVSGGAGSGKTWLVRDWARRAEARGERTAVVCFNRPMADRLAGEIGNDESTVDSYHNLAVRLLEPFGFEVPTDPDPQWWETVPTEALLAHADGVGTPFDTIIVDEAQDLRPAWLDSLRVLLDPEGPQRLLMVMDPAQAIYTSEWSDLVEFFRATLEVNLRNSRSIGALCARLGGPTTLQDNPAGPAPDFHRATGNKELRKHVERTIDHLLEDEKVHPSEIAVLTTHTSTRDALIGTVTGATSLTRWEERDSGSVLCETIHRTKGLEWTAVIIASLDDPISEQLLYIGASRPRMHLTLIGAENMRDAGLHRLTGH